MAYDLGLWISTVVLAVVSLWRYRLQLTVLNVFQGAWVLIIALPSALRYTGVETTPKERLFLSTIVVNFALLTAVLVHSSKWFQELLDRFPQRSQPVQESTRYGLPRWFWVGLAFSLSIFLVHSAMMPKIPLLELIFGNGVTPQRLAEAREAANKLLPLPIGVTYLLNWNVRVVVPLLMTLLVLRGGKRVKIIWPPLLIALSAMTFEKSLPVLAIMSCAFAVAIHRRGSIVSRPMVFGLVLALGVLSSLLAASKLRQMQAFRTSSAATVSPDGGSHQDPMLGDSSAEGTSTSWQVLGHAVVSYPIRFVFNRVLSAPSQVAYFWFEYFPDVFGGFLRGRTWAVLDRTHPDFQHPANLVGLYYYHREDPEHYLSTVHAYGAFHADAWANFGYPGVAVASVAVVIILMVTELAVRFSSSAVTAGAGGAGLSILLSTLPSGGVQAALVAQGLVLCLAIGLVPIWKRAQSWPGPTVATESSSR